MTDNENIERSLGDVSRVSHTVLAMVIGRSVSRLHLLTFQMRPIVSPFRRLLEILEKMDPVAKPCS